MIEDQAREIKSINKSGDDVTLYVEKKNRVSLTRNVQ